MRSVSTYVENGVSLAHDVGSAAWVYDLDLWGTCGQGTDQGAALRDLRRRLGHRVDLVVVEQIRGDEQAFARDRLPCTRDEREVTLDILGRVRRETIALLRSCTPAELDSEDHNRALPSFASWRTLRQMGWHIADCECRYYLPAAGLPTRSRRTDLLEELAESAAHVRRQLRAMPADLRAARDGEVWTAVKLLRRLAWHERGELEVMRTMLRRLRGTQ